MADRRRANVSWIVADENGKILSVDHANLAVLMDLRDELKQLNRVFACHNFQMMPHEIKKLRIATERLDRRFAKKLKKPSAPVAVR